MTTKRNIVGVMCLTTLLICNSAFAYRGYGGGGWHSGGGTRIGLSVGVPVFAAPYYGYGGSSFGFSPYSYPYSYPVPVTTVIAAPPAPITYVEKNEQPAEGYWHYCHEPAGYYPQVLKCSGSWQKIPPTLPDR